MTEVLRGEDGGSIDGYIARFKLLENTHIIIDGDCNSACTMVLGNRDVCSTERGRLNFHHASNGDTGRPSPAGTAQLMARYPLNVREWMEFPGRPDRQMDQRPRPNVSAQLLRCR